MNVYDFDGSIYRRDSSLRFFFFALKKNPLLLRFVPNFLIGLLLYSIKKINKTQLKERFFSFLRGIRDLPALVDAFWAKNKRYIFDWYQIQKQETDLVISASPEFLLQPICAQLGIQHPIASVVDPQTGFFQSPNCHDVEKVVRFRAIYPDEKIHQFYSDSLSDLPLAQLAENAFLIKNGRPVSWFPEK